MPTDTAPRRTGGTDFALRAVAWGVGLFGLLRLDWVELHLLLPLTQLQGRLAAALCGEPARPVAATLACSGADVLAICLGAILAYPASWRRRIVGAGAGVALVLALNTLRIGTLGALAASPTAFRAFHLYVWPAVLSLAVAALVFSWMRLADRQRRRAPSPLPERAPARAQGRGFGPTRSFALLAAALLVLFTVSAPLYLQSEGVLGAAALVARAAAAALHLFGVEARASANQLWTSRGSFLVTQECISTPLIPVYVAAVFAYAGTWRRRLPALLFAPPLFLGLGVARLLVVAVPASLAASPAHVVHAFFQMLLAAVVVFVAAARRSPGPWHAARRALLGVGLGSAFALFLGAPYTRLVLHAGRVVAGGAGAGTPPEDPQGAIALLPAFQAGLYLALWAAARVAPGWQRLVAGLALLGLLQLATLSTFALLAGSLGASIAVQGVRAWAVAAPVLVLALVHCCQPAGGVAPPATSASGGARG